jgi:hypothetical protein
VFILVSEYSFRYSSDLVLKIFITIAGGTSLSTLKTLPLLAFGITLPTVVVGTGFSHVQIGRRKRIRVQVGWW